MLVSDHGVVCLSPETVDHKLLYRYELFDPPDFCPRGRGIYRFFTFINHYPSTPKALSTNSPRLATKRIHMIFLGAAPVFQLLLKDRGPDLGGERSVFENSELVPI